MEQNILAAIENLSRAAAAIPGGLEAMKAAMVRTQEHQGAQDECAAESHEQPKGVSGVEEESGGEAFTQEGQRLGDNQEAVASETVEEMEPASDDFEAGFGSDLASAPEEDVAEPEAAAADPGQAEEEGPFLMPYSDRYPAERILIGEVPEDSAHELMERWKSGLVATASEEQPVEENAPAEGETSSPDLADSLDSAGDVLERALSEIRMMMDQLRFARELDSEQAEQMTREIAATREGVLALAGMVNELREVTETNSETLGVLALAAPTQTTLSELQGLVLEQNSSTERILVLLREGQNIIHEDLSKGTSDLGNYLGAELAKLHEPLNASQAAMGQAISGIEGVRSKLTQTWGISLFWLAAVVIFIVIRSIVGFLG